MDEVILNLMQVNFVQNSIENYITFLKLFKRNEN